MGALPALAVLFEETRRIHGGRGALSTGEYLRQLRRMGPAALMLGVLLGVPVLLLVTIGALAVRSGALLTAGAVITCLFAFCGFATHIGPSLLVVSRSAADATARASALQALRRCVQQLLRHPGWSITGSLAVAGWCGLLLLCPQQILLVPILVAGSTPALMITAIAGRIDNNNESGGHVSRYRDQAQLRELSLHPGR